MAEQSVPAPPSNFAWNGQPATELGKSPKLTELVADWLRRQIVSGQLKEGDFLPPEPELMVQLGISRPTLREAMRVLESEQLIVTRRGSRTGARVQAPSFELSARSMGLLLQYNGVTLEDVHRARLVLEPPLAGLAATNKTEAAITALSEALDAESDALDDEIEHSHAATLFHEKLAELAGIETLAVSVKQCNWLIDREIRHVIESRTPTEREETAKNANRSYRSHARLVEIFKSGTPADVETYWREHVERIGQLYIGHSRSYDIIDLFD